MTVQPINLITTNTLDTASVTIASWGTSGTPMANGDTGAPAQLPQKNDISIQAEGTFGSGGSVALEGSNDGTNYHALKDKNGTLIALTAAGIASCNVACLYYRPHVTAGDGTTALIVTAVFKTTLAQ